MNYFLLIGGLGILLLGFSMSLNQNPVLCKTLKLKFICKQNNFLRKLFPYKEDRYHPYSLLRILPLFISIIILSIILIVYILYWVGSIQFINNFIESKMSFIIGTALLVLYFLYPLFMLLFNYIFEMREKMMTQEERDELNDNHEKYYEQFDK